jgi:hypothetical protein
VVLEPSASVRLVAEPKPGGVRWLARLDARTGAAYAASVAPLVPAIERELPPAVVANRVVFARIDPPAIRLESWRAARSRFQRLVRAGASGAGAALMTDVRECYASIGAPLVAQALASLGARGAELGPVLALLRRLEAHGVRGLPIGPEASAVLANAVLLRIDRRLAEAGFAHVRWVDDLIVFADHVGAAGDALGIVRTTLSEMGLAPAEHKTRVVVDPALIRGGGPMPGSGPRPRTARARG